MLDTNIWLDWLVFDNAEMTPLKSALTSGRMSLTINPPCLAELTRVLAYPLGRFTLDAAARERAQAACLACARLESPAANTSPLPTCRDPDDQKFLQLARDCGAGWLVTRDRDLLILARGRALPVPFRIVTPRTFAATLLGAMSTQLAQERPTASTSPVRRDRACV